MSQVLKTGDPGLWICFPCHDFPLNSQCTCVLRARTQSDSFSLRGSPWSLHCSNTRVQRLVGRSNMGYWRTHSFAFLISTLIPLLFHRRREPNCKWVEGDLEKDTGWPLRIHLVISLSVSVTVRPWGQMGGTQSHASFKGLDGQFLHCVSQDLISQQQQQQQHRFLRTLDLTSTVNS